MEPTLNVARQVISVDRLLMRTWSDGEAAVVRELLRCYGVPCRVVSEVPHSVLPIAVDGLGELRILVSDCSLEEACRLLSEHRRLGFELLHGGVATPDDPDEADRGVA